VALDTAVAAEVDEGPTSATAATAERKQPSKAPRSAKIPKLPMVQYGKKWYRAKVLKDVPGKVLVEFQGYSHEGGPFWLSKDSSRLWRGSYKGRDWKYLVSGHGRRVCCPSSMVGKHGIVAWY
jgi:hypothetical protein